MEKQKKSSLGIVCLIFGILSLVLGWFPVIGWLFILTTWVLFIVAIKEGQKDTKVFVGLGLSILGLLFAISMFNNLFNDEINNTVLNDSNIVNQYTEIKEDLKDELIETETNIIINQEETIEEQAQKEDILRAEQKSNQCPKQGFMQSDLSYCIELCMLSDNEIGSFCDNICYQYKELDGSSGSRFINEIIQSYKCSKCGECTEEQLNEIEEKRKQSEEAEIAYNKSIEKAILKKEEDLRIKEEQETIKKEKWLELEKQIDSQSDKFNGYIYIKNTSGEPRQFIESGITYEFPFPAEDPTKVPTDLGKRLLVSNHYELVIK